eukprot:m.88546 g.88546  ORF g.88546 m.88546 type:complete len:835 (+) comp14543_c0_seq4:3-2507(+)
MMMMMMLNGYRWQQTLLVIMTILAVYTFMAPTNAASLSYYEVLQVKTDATTKEIRRAFKQLALQYHPDKNKGDPDAHETFIKINTAFEVLKDPKLRKIYDNLGEEGLKDAQAGGGGGARQNQYHSWDYYKDMGLYDDDEYVETFTQSDFWTLAVESEEVWFVNFYSPGCSHCRELAPTWKQFAHAMRDVVGIGAVNCAENWHLCRRVGIEVYPTLLVFPNSDGSSVPYSLPARDVDSFTEFVEGFLEPPLPSTSLLNDDGEFVKEERVRPIVIGLCLSADADWSICEDFYAQEKKLAAMLQPISDVSLVPCPGPFCSERLTAHEGDDFSGIVLLLLLPTTPIKDAVTIRISVDELEDQVAFRVAAQQVWSKFPELGFADPSAQASTSFPQVILLEQQEQSRTLPVVYHKLLKTLPYQTDLPVLRIDCAIVDCSMYELQKFPAIVLRRSGVDTDYEVYHGDYVASLLNRWLLSTVSSRVHTFTPRLFPQLLSDPEFDFLFIDFFAPWCGPCRQMLPVWQEASAMVYPEGLHIMFGSVDCHAHERLCAQFNIRSYPSPIAYIQGTSTPHPFSGNFMSAAELFEFVDMTLHPAVVKMDANMFEQEVARGANDMWIIDFFAPWCGHCQALAPEYARAAHRLKGVVRMATVDCTREQKLCQREHIRAYPTIRFFMPGETPRRVIHYRGHHNADWLMGAILEHLPDEIPDFSASELEDRVAWGDALMLVSFGAPWCGPCRDFKPTFNRIATTLRTSPDLEPFSIQFGRVDCQTYRFKCNELNLPHYPIVLLFIPGEGHVTLHSQDPNQIVQVVHEIVETIRNQQEDNNGDDADTNQHDEL